MSIFKMKKAQSTAEYVIILGLVIGAVIAMQTYVKRGLQARVQEATDFVHNPTDGAQVNFTGEQYEPYYLESKFTSKKSGESTAGLDTDGSGAAHKTIVSEHSDRTGNQTIYIGSADHD